MGDSSNSLLEHQEAPRDKKKAQTFQTSIEMFKVKSRCYSIVLLTFCPISHADLVNVSEEYKGMLEAIEGILHRHSLGISSDRRSFSCHGSIVVSLFFISVKCRDARTRHRGLSLLAGMTQREGIWDPQMMAGIARNLMEFELNGERFPVNGDGSTIVDFAAELFDSEAEYHVLAMRIVHEWNVYSEELSPRHLHPGLFAKIA